MVDSRNCHEQSVRVLSDDCYEMSDWENVMSNYVSKLEKEYTKKTNRCPSTYERFSH